MVFFKPRNSNISITVSNSGQIIWIYYNSNNIYACDDMFGILIIT